MGTIKGSEMLFVTGRVVVLSMLFRTIAVNRFEVGKSLCSHREAVPSTNPGKQPDEKGICKEPYLK